MGNASRSGSAVVLILAAQSAANASAPSKNLEDMHELMRFEHFVRGLGRVTEETALDIESPPGPLVDERWRSFRRQKVGGCERVTRVAATGLGRVASKFTRHHVGKPAGPSRSIDAVFDQNGFS